MAKIIDFYFDFMSPYAYLAHHHLLAVQVKFGFEIKYHPVDLPYVKTRVGNTGPSNRSIPAKIDYLMIDLKRWAHRYAVGLLVPETHDSKLANIGAIIANDRGDPTEYVKAVWQRTWGSGGDFASISLLREVAHSLKWNADEFETLIHSEQLQARYFASSDIAIGKGVFGVPTMVVDGLMWWGNDRLFMLEEHLTRESLVKTL